MIYVRRYTASFQRSLRLQIAPVIEQMGTKLPQDVEVNLDPDPVSFDLRYLEGMTIVCCVDHLEVPGRCCGKVDLKPLLIRIIIKGS